MEIALRCTPISCARDSCVSGNVSPPDRSHARNSQRDRRASTECEAVQGRQVATFAIIDTNEEIDLLLTDVMMPGSINGRQLAVEALNRRPSLKVLYTSGYSENAMIHDGHLDPGVLLLAKPYRKVDLARMIRVALAA